MTRAHVRQWLQSVAHRVPSRLWGEYVRGWDVPARIARELAAGTFERTVAQAAAAAGVTVRRARRPGTLARLRRDWPQAANQAGGPADDSSHTSSAGSAPPAAVASASTGSG